MFLDFYADYYRKLLDKGKDIDALAEEEEDVAAITAQWAAEDGDDDEEEICRVVNESSADDWEDV
jgi:hypothetical protein